MRKFFYLAVSLLLTSNAMAANKPPVITLTSRNTVVLRNVVNSQSTANVQQKAIKLSQGLSKNEPIYLLLDTPGGDIQSGTEMITTLNALPQKVHTITNFAASMGFITVQSLDNRYILPGGILMSHRARGGAQGQIPGELNTRVNFWTNMLDSVDAKIAARVKLPKAKYQEMIKNEHWTYGAEAVRTNMADKIVLVRCSKELIDSTTVEEVETFFGQVKVTYSNCPLITVPLKVDFSEIALSRYDDRENSVLINLRKVVLTLLYDKEQFYHDYVITNKFRNYLP